MMCDFNPILQRIKNAKSISGLTNEELAAKSGVPFSTLNKILSGETTEPKLPTIMAITAAFDASADYLIYGTCNSSQINLSSDETHLLDLFRNLNSQGKGYILQTIEMAATTYKE